MAEPYFKGGPKPQTLSETAEDFYGIGSYLSLMAPSAGISDVLGFAPDPSKVGDTMPSFSENIESGNYLDAGLQTLGASGDVMLAASPFFPALAVPAAVAKGLSTVGKSMKSTKSLPSKSDAPQDVFHYTPDAELGFTIFDPDKAPSALDALGTHVGSPKAARERFESLNSLRLGPLPKFATGNLGYDEAGNIIPRTTFGGTYPLKANLSKPYTPKGKAGSRVKDVDVWDEEGINMHLLIEYNKDRFGDAYSPKAYDMGHLVGDKPDFPFSDFRKFIGEFRLKLADEGFTHLPYYNAVEDAGSISYVMLTDRPKGSASVLKGKFGANDPKERSNPDIMKEAGGAVLPLGERPAWLTRALDPSTPMTESLETVRTASIDGRLFPTIRLVNGELVRYSNIEEAYRTSLDNNDFIQFKNDDEATSFSKLLSQMIANKRQNPDTMKEAGGVISLKDKAVNMTRGPQGIEPFIKFMV